MRRNAALRTEPQKTDGCFAFVDPPCSRGAVRHNLCLKHMDGYEGTNWHRAEYTGADGKQHSYIALDTVPPPALMDPRTIVRVIGTHAPASGRCPCCWHPFSTETHVWVLHTTWRPRGDVTSVCGPCGAVGHRHIQPQAAATTLAGPGSNGAVDDHEDSL